MIPIDSAFEGDEAALQLRPLTGISLRWGREAAPQMVTLGEMYKESATACP